MQNGQMILVQQNRLVNPQHTQQSMQQPIHQQIQTAALPSQDQTISRVANEAKIYALAIRQAGIQSGQNLQIRAHHPPAPHWFHRNYEITISNEEKGKIDEISAKELASIENSNKKRKSDGSSPIDMKKLKPLQMPSPLQINRQNVVMGQQGMVQQGMGQQGMGPQGMGQGMVMSQALANNVGTIGHPNMAHANQFTVGDLAKKPTIITKNLIPGI